MSSLGHWYFSLIFLKPKVSLEIMNLSRIVRDSDLPGKKRKVGLQEATGSYLGVSYYIFGSGSNIWEK